MLLKEPNRSQRPPQIIIFLRGLPGSGKSYVADLIKVKIFGTSSLIS